MRAGTIAKRYARAFHELGEETKKGRVLQKQLHGFADLYAKSTVLQTVLLNPSIELDQRRNLLVALGRKQMWDGLMVSFVRLLLDKDRIRFIGEIAVEYDRLADETAGIVRATLTTPQAIKDSDRISVEGALAKLTGKRVILATEIDASLLGGAVTQIGSQIYDGSVRTQIQRLRETILAAE